MQALKEGRFRGAPSIYNRNAIPPPVSNEYVLPDVVSAIDETLHVADMMESDFLEDECADLGNTLTFLDDEALAPGGTNEESKVHLGDIHRMSIKQKQEEQNMKEKYCRSISGSNDEDVEDDDELEELMRIRAARRKKAL